MVRRINSSRPENKYSLETYIDEGRQSEVSFDKIVYLRKEKVNGNLFPVGDVYSRYREIIDMYTIEVKMSNEQRDRYLYNPNILSYDLYKTTELWSLLLFVNDAINSSRFRFTSKVKIFDPNRMDIINKIILLEEEAIAQNRLENGM